MLKDISNKLPFYFNIICLVIGVIISFGTQNFIPLVLIIIGVCVLERVLFRKRREIFDLLYTAKNREEYEKETGCLPFDMGDPTKRYKAWLMQRYREGKAQYQPQPPSQAQIKEEKATQIVTCSYCGSKNFKSAKFCVNCGSPLS